MLKGKLAAFGCLAALLVVAPAAQAAPTASAAKVVRACVKKKKGTMRLLSKGIKCKKSEKALDLYASPGEAGPKGDTGPAGANGTNGSAGVKGDTGAGGPTGPIGAQGVDGSAGATGPTGPAGSADTAQDVLGKLLQVDGAGSGLDTDLFDGLDAGAFQRRGTTTSCSAGQFATGIAANGDLGCAADQNTTYTAGTGLTLDGTTMNVNDARYKALCPDIASLGGTVWTGSVCITKNVDHFTSNWNASMNWCVTLWGGGRLPTYAELIQASKLGVITLEVGEWTADSAGDDSAIFINATDNANADGVRARSTSGIGQRCAYMPRQASLSAP